MGATVRMTEYKIVRPLLLLAFGQGVRASNVDHHIAISIGFACVTAAALDSFSLAGTADKLPRACCTYGFAILACIFSVSLDVDLVTTGQSADHISVRLGAGLGDVHRIGSHIVFGLGAGDIHRLCPGALTLADRQRV